MSKWNDNAGSTWESPPIKSMNGRVIGIYDIGTQDGFKDGAPKRQVVFLYELISATTKDSKGKNFMIAEFMSVGNHSKTKSIARIQAIANVKFKPSGSVSENGFFYELPENMNEILKEKVLGAAVLVNLVPKTNDPTKAMVGNVSQPMEGIVVGPAENGLGWLDPDDTANLQSDLLAAPDWVKKKYNACHEVRGIKPQAPASAPSRAPSVEPKIDPETGAPLQPTVAPGAYEDDIPF